jgi:farnesyl diphosphate synthase
MTAAAVPLDTSSDPTADPFQARLATSAGEVEAELARSLAPTLLPGEIARPDRLMAALRHATLNGGKRLRPYLVIESAEMLDPDRAGDNRSGLVRVAAALELVHCYSLVHDDLPAMDDDDIRRGQPTVHKAFDEATAILAGDALLTLAFDLLADERTSPDPQVRLDLVMGLARASGLGGMVGGQMLDLAAEGRHAPDRAPLQLSEPEIRQLQAMKTGALLRYACEAGAIFAGSPARVRELMATFGRLIGQAFQIADDLIDLESAPATAGKATGKDAARGKATLISLNGADAARIELDRLIEQADDCLTEIGGDARHLRNAARFIAKRAF